MIPDNYDHLLNEISRIAKSRTPDPVKIVNHQLELAAQTLDAPNPLIRPLNRKGDGGGLLFLHTDIPLLILPDLHARKDFLADILMLPLQGGTVWDRLREKSIQILCVGDGFHAEKRAYKRWLRCLDEYRNEYRRHKFMDREMSESMGVMQIVMLLKSYFPDHFFFLKGNHENILNEEGRGNHPFGKFVYEGEMVRTWVQKFMGESFLHSYSEFEHKLPFMALTGELVISHAEPEHYYNPDEIINIDGNDRIKLGLTWTANNQAEEGSVTEILDKYSSVFNRDFTHYIGGHRTINGLYNLRVSGRFVQIHNPDRRVILYSNQMEPFHPDSNICDLDQIRSLSI